MIDLEIIENLKQSFASAVQRIHIASLNKTYTFREASVMETKNLAKVILANSNQQSVVYAATLAMIQQLCLDKDFDSHKISEFDRLKIIVHLFSNNFFSKNLNIKCPRKGCSHTFKFAMKYGELLKSMDKVDCSDIIFENTTRIGKITVYANFPNAFRYLNLLEAVDGDIENEKLKSIKENAEKDYEQMNSSFRELDQNAEKSGSSLSDVEDAVSKIRKRRNILKGKIQKIVEDRNNVLGNVDIRKIGSEQYMLDIADIYIKRIKIDWIYGCGDQYDLDMENLGYDDTERILESLPQSLFIKEDGTNIIKFITNEIFKRMNKCVPEIKCENCGYPISKKLTLQNFFIFG